MTEPSAHRAERRLLLLPIEIKVREFHGKLLFAAHAVEAGFDVVLGGQNRLMADLAFLDRGLYIDKSVAVTKEHWFARCHRLGCKVAAWDEEGLIYLNDSFYLQNRVSEKSLAQVEAFFAWGSVQASAIASAHPDLAERLHPTGNPRFDLLRPEFRAFFDEPARRIRERHGRLILVNTNFGHYNHFKGLEQSRAILNRYPIARIPDFVDGWIAYQKRGLETFVAALPALSRAFPEHTILVRPSPSENRGTWEQAVAGLPNAKVAWEGNVLEWIRAADAVVHFNCTTGLEAFLLETPPVALHPGEDGRFEPVLPKAVSDLVTDAEGLVEAVRRALDGRGSPARPDILERAEPLLRRYLASHGSTTASDALVQRLATLPFPDRRRRTLLDRLRQRKNDAYPALLRWLNRNRIALDTYEEQKFGGLESAEIEDALRRLRAASGRFAGVGTRPLRKDIHLITLRDGPA